MANEAGTGGGTLRLFIDACHSFLYNVNQLIDACPLLIRAPTKTDGRAALGRETRRERKREREKEGGGAVANPEVTGGAMRAIACTLRGSLARKGDANCASGTERRRMAQLVPVYCETARVRSHWRGQVAYGCNGKKNIRGPR